MGYEHFCFMAGRTVSTELLEEKKKESFEHVLILNESEVKVRRIDWNFWEGFIKSNRVLS